MRLLHMVGAVGLSFFIGAAIGNSYGYRGVVEKVTAAVNKTRDAEQAKATKALWEWRQKTQKELSDQIEFERAEHARAADRLKDDRDRAQHSAKEVEKQLEREKRNASKQIAELRGKLDTECLFSGDLRRVLDNAAGAGRAYNTGAVGDPPAASPGATPSPDTSSPLLTCDDLVLGYTNLATYTDELYGRADELLKFVQGLK